MALHTETKKEKEQEQRWEAEQDIRTLTNANEIRKDKPRMRRAQKMAREQRAALARVAK